MQLEYWKLGTDLALAFSLAYLCYRLIRGQRATLSSQQVGALESSLRNVMGEADQAGRSLSEILLKRQQSLEKLLYEMGTVENRINRAISTAEIKKGELELEAKRAESLSRYAHVEAARVSQAEIQSPRFVDPEPPSFTKGPERERYTPPPVRSVTAKVNIYGDPIANQTASPTAYRPLATQIERELATPQREEPRATTISNPIEDIYTAAENMLRAGADLDSVSLATDIPISDLKLLAQYLSREAAVSNTIEVEHQSTDSELERAPISNDPRLGVLGGIKRQTQVL